MTDIVERPVADLYVQCMFQTENLDQPALAASDCCLRPAYYAIQNPDNKNWYWRCFDHRDLLDYSRKGEFSETVKVRTDR